MDSSPCLTTVNKINKMDTVDEEDTTVIGIAACATTLAADKLTERDMEAKVGDTEDTTVTAAACAAEQRLVMATDKLPDLAIKAEEQIVASDADVVENGDVCMMQSIVDKTLNSTCRQMSLIVALVMWAVLTVYAAEINFFVLIASLIHLIAHIIVTTCVICRRKERQTHLITLTTLFLYLVALFSINIPCIAFPCKIVAGSLALPYLVMCLQQIDKMHILITSVFVLPTVLGSILAVDLHAAVRSSLYLPAVLYFLYKLMALGCSSGRFEALVREPIRAKPFICVFCALLLIGSAITAYTVAVKERQSAQAVVGWALIFAAGISYTFLKLIQNWEAPLLITKKSVAQKLQRMSLLIGVIGIMCLVIPAIYLSLCVCRYIVIPLAILLTCLYFLFVHLFYPIHRVIPNIAYFLLIIASFSAYFNCTYHRLSLFDNQPWAEQVLIRGEFLSEEDHFRMNKTRASMVALKKETENQIDTETFAVIQCFLLFVYFMLTALAKTDHLAKAAEKDAVLRAAQEGEGEPCVADAAADVEAAVEGEPLVVESPADV